MQELNEALDLPPAALPEVNSRPTLVYFPQWQGTGATNKVQTGAETIRNQFESVATLEVPLSDAGMAEEHDIIGYRTLVAQLQAATAVLQQQQPERLLLIAGDCAAELAPINYLNNRYGGNLAVVWLDAHADLNTPSSSPSRHFHGMPLHLLLDGKFPGTAFEVDKPLSAKQVVLVGLRDADLPEQEFIRENKISVLPATDFPNELFDAALQKSGLKNVYIHLDLDALNPLEFPALQCPTPEGFSVEKITQLLRHLQLGYHVVGMSLTETTAATASDLTSIQPILSEYRKWLANPEEPGTASGASG